MFVVMNMFMIVYLCRSKNIDEFGLERTEFSVLRIHMQLSNTKLLLHDSATYRSDAILSVEEFYHFNQNLSYLIFLLSILPCSPHDPF